MMARYCTQCGAALGATKVQGRTLLARPHAAATALSERDLRTVIERAETTFGTDVTNCCTEPLTLTRSGQREHTVFVNDVSGSMGETFDGSMTKSAAAIRAAVNMVLQKAKIDPHDEVGVVAFTNCARIVLTMSPIVSQKARILRAIQSLRSGGRTDIDTGLRAARQLFDWDQADVVRRVELLTDGLGGNPRATAEDLKRHGVVIDVVGIGAHPRDVNEGLLKQVASVVEGELHYRFVRDQQTLLAHYTQLAGKTAVSR